MISVSSRKSAASTQSRANPELILATTSDRGTYDEASRQTITLAVRIPFGGGPRLCIGHQFAVVEMQIALAMLFQRFEFERIGNEPVSMIPSITLRPGDPIHFRFWERG